MKKSITRDFEVVCGLDLGDKASRLCVLSKTSGEVLEESRIRTTPVGIRGRFGGHRRMRVALEVGTHSPWVSELLEEAGHEVVVANPRKVRLIGESRQKDDRLDAEYLARLARVDPKLLSPVQHREQEVRADLGLVRSRDALVRSRTSLINHVRGMVKPFGVRIRSCSAHSFAGVAEEEIPKELEAVLGPVVETIGSLTRLIRRYDKTIEEVVEEKYPVANHLRQIRGVGAVTSLTYVLTLEDPDRFKKSRDVGPYLGLVPARRASGNTNPQLRITKAGDVFLRRLLVNAAHYMLGPFGEDCDLRRYGLRIAQRGGKTAKKRAVVAVARKLAVVLHRLWVTGEVYEPFHTTQQTTTAAA
jgi:transposase